MRLAFRFHALVVCAVTFLVVTLSVFATHAQPVGVVPGTIDTTFGGGEPIKVEVVGNGGHVVNAVAITASNRVVMAGTCQPIVNNVGGLRRWCLSRHDSDGTLDVTFDGPGTTPGNGSFEVRITSGQDLLRAMAIQTDGKIVVVGQCDTQLCIARFNTSGVLDTTFSGNGWALLGPQGADENRAYDVALQSDGKAVIASECDRPASPGNKRACIWRVNANGSVDTSFDAGAVGTGSGLVTHLMGDEDSRPRKLAVQTDGKILIAGDCKPSYLDDETTSRVCFVRLTANGAVDTTFSTDGRLRVAFSATKGSYATALALQPDGKSVVGGECSDGTDALNFFGQPTGKYFPCLVRLNIDGTPDTTFVNPLDATESGKFLLKLDPVEVNAFPAIRDLLVQPDGKLVMVFGTGTYVQGTCRSAASSTLKCVAARLNGDGSFDLLFDGKRDTDNNAGNGIAYADRLKAFTAPVAALQANGKIVIAGACQQDGGLASRLCVQRFSGGDGTPLACNLDVDGNGDVRLASDGLMMLRAMRSVIDTSIINAADVPASAPRSTWTEVRDHLVESCGAPPARGPRLARAATVCSLDIDGDNDVLATTDGVLLLRALLGFTGTALTENVPIVTAATRKTPALISGFLTTQCGLSL
jgi:uncharacterized delta-60 repeat protein